MLRRRPDIRTQLLTGTTIAGLAVIVLCPAPSYAACDINAPNTGNTVTCSSGVPDTSGVIKTTANNVTVNVQNNAVIDLTAGGAAIDLNDTIQINLNTGSQVINTGTDTITINSGVVTLSGAGTLVQAQTSGTNAIVADGGGLTVNVGVGSTVRADTDGTQKAIAYTAGGAHAVNVTVLGTIQADAAGYAVDFGTSTASFSLGTAASVSGLVAAGAGLTDSFVLDGTGSGTFDTSLIGTQYTGFDTFIKDGSSSWTLSGTGTQNWTVSTGTLIGTTTSLQGNVATSAFTSTQFQGASGTYAGVISGSGGVTVKGGNTITFSGANTYTGGTTISDASTILAGTTTSLTGNIASTDASQVLRFSQAGSGTYAGNYSGAGALQLQGGGTYTLSGTNTYSGGTALSGAGTTLIGTTTSLTGSISASDATSVLRVDQAGNGTFNASYTGTGALEIQGGGNITLGGALAHTGGTSLSGAGTTLIGTTSTLTGDVSTGAGTDVEFSQAAGGTYAGVISGTGAITVSSTGAGALTLSGVNTNTGGVTLSGGSTVNINAESGLGDTSGQLTLNSGTLHYNNAISTARTTLVSGNGTIDTDAAVTMSGVISGGSTLTKSGTGELTLSGTNTTTGGFTVTGGALVTDTNASLGNGGTLTLNGGTLKAAASYTDTHAASLGGSNGTINTNGNDLAMSGIISGAGSLEKTGTGLLTLSGVNTYSGGTTVSGGSVLVNADSGFGNTAGAVTLDGATFITGGAINSIRNYTLGAGNATIDTNNITSTISGIISGAGDLTKSNTGILILSGVNTYTGDTTITGGSIVINAESGLGNSAANVTLDGGALQYNAGFSTTRTTTLGAGNGTIDTNGNAVTMSGVVSGAGNLTKSGTGVLTLSAANTYTGTTTITGGAVNLSAEDALGNNATDILLNGGGLQYGASFALTRGITLGGSNGTIDTNGNSATIGTVISGAGALTKSGAGNLTLTGTNTYSGGTTISGGTLTGTTTTLQGDITNNAALAFNQNTDGTFTDVISGTGTLEKLGTGNTILTGVNTYTGNTTVTAGKLSVNGSITGSNVTVGAAGTLGGNGTTGSVTVDGTLAPGNSIDTINVNGNLVFNNGSTYAIEIDDAGQSDKTIATGAITINGGTVDITAAAGTYAASTNYTILQGASVTGTFDTLVDNMAFLDASLTYNAADVILTMTRNDLGFGDVTNDSVQQGVADGITELGSGTDIFDAILSMSATDARNAFDMLSGESLAGTAGVIANSATIVNNVVSNRMATLNSLAPVKSTNNADPASIEPAAGDTSATIDDKVTPQRYQFWAEVTGSHGRSLAQNTAPEQSRDGAGVLVGMDRQLDDNGYFGIYAGAEQSEVETNSQNASSEIKSFHAGLYRTKPLQDNWRISGGLGGSAHAIESKRYVLISGFGANASGDTKGASISSFVEAAKTYEAPKSIAIEPYASVNVSASRINGFTETGGGSANLAVDATTTANIGHTLGVRAGKNISDTVSVRGGAGWQHTYGNLDSGTTMRFAAGTLPFTVYGPKRVADAAVVNLAVDSLLKNSMTAYAHYDGLLAKADQDHKISLGLKIPFSIFDAKTDPADRITFNDPTPGIVTTQPEASVAAPPPEAEKTPRLGTAAYAASQESKPTPPQAPELPPEAEKYHRLGTSDQTSAAPVATPAVTPAAVPPAINQIFPYAEDTKKADVTDTKAITVTKTTIVDESAPAISQIFPYASQKVTANPSPAGSFKLVSGKKSAPAD